MAHGLQPTSDDEKNKLGSFGTMPQWSNDEDKGSVSSL